MTRRCVFVAGIDPEAEEISLSESLSHQLQSVLRLKTGDPVELRDGAGGSWLGEVCGMARGVARVRLLQRREIPGAEPPVDITLAMAFARAEKMDLAIRQATELGASGIAAFRAKRSQYGLSAQQAEARKDRWQKIVREAMCQCGRINAPHVSVFPDVHAFIEAVSSGSGHGEECLKIFAWEEELQRDLFSLRNSFPDCGRIIAVIGPEGGWDGSEADWLLDSGFHPVHLGPRTLRLETAAVALVSMVQMLWGDFGPVKQGRSNKNEMQ
jgi:16S rRNA (uracil1498-N3)-methyltransferase